MAVPFPLTPAPTYYTTCSFPNNRNGIFYVGGTAPVVTLNKTGATTYEVKDYWGNTVSSGSVSGTTVTPTAPVGGWKPGWYRFYLRGTSTDAVFGDAYGSCNFSVVRNDPHFVTMPAVGVGPTTGGGEAADVILKGVMVGGPTRKQITATWNPENNPLDNVHQDNSTATFANTYYNKAADPAFDPNRFKPLFVQFPNKSVDYYDVPANSGKYIRCYALPGVDASKVYVSGGAGTSSGSKIQIFYPDASTLVETYDNNSNSTAASNAINARPSAYVYSTDIGAGAINAATSSPTVIAAGYNAGLTYAVTNLWPNYLYFEGPFNEPSLSADSAYQSQLFGDIVHTANPDAKAMGPVFVDIMQLTGTQSWKTFFDNNGHTKYDAISTHAYNFCTNGDINLGRSALENWFALKNQYAPNLPVWITESTHVWVSVAGVLHPRRSRVPLIQTLLCEQYGIPREQNLVWYDQQHGFWGYPAWCENTNGSLVPYVLLYRVLAEETWGQTHHHRIDFGSPAANAIFLGSVYQTSKNTLSPGTAVILTQSYIPGAQVILNVVGGVSSLTVVDGFGNLSTVSVSGGQATVPIQEIPTYIRLPAGVSITVDSVFDWGPTPNPSVSSAATATLGGVSAPALNDDSFMTNYANQSGVAISSASLPDDAILTFPQTISVDRLVIFCGPYWQSMSGLFDYDVMTSTDGGTTWTTQVTETKSPFPSSFQFGADGTDSGCSRETYDPEQYIEIVSFASPVSCNAVKVHVRTTSYGGEPDIAAATGMGQGTQPPHLKFEEIMVISGTSLAASPTSVTATATLSATSGTWAGLVVTYKSDGVSSIGTPVERLGLSNHSWGTTVDVLVHPTSTVTAGTTAILGMTMGSGDTLVSVSDSVGNTWTLDASYSNGDQTVAWASCHVTTQITSSDTITLHRATNNGLSGSLWLEEVTGLATSSRLDKTLSATGNGVTGTVGPTATLSQVDEIAFAGFRSNQTTAFTAGNGWTSLTTPLGQYQILSSTSNKPSNLTAPAITGNGKLGTQLSCSLGKWFNTPTSHVFQWKRDGSNISGATHGAYTITASDVGHAISCSVTATNRSGSTTQASSNSVTASKNSVAAGVTI